MNADLPAVAARSAPLGTASLLWVTYDSMLPSLYTTCGLYGEKWESGKERKRKVRKREEMLGEI